MHPLKKPITTTRWVRKLSGATRKHTTDVAGIVFFSGISLTALGLGIWQSKRYLWKIDLIKNGLDKLHNEPYVLTDNSTQDELANIIIAKKGQIICLGKGYFDHSKEILLGPRSAPEATAQGMASNPQGYYIITPFRRLNGTVVFVKRGWVPLKMNPASSWSRPTGYIELTALASHCEKKGTFSPENSPETGRILWLEEDVLKKLLTTSTTAVASGGSNNFIDENNLSISLVEDIADLVTDSTNSYTIVDKSISRYPLRRSIHTIQEQSITPMTHLVYATTWYSLAVAGAVMTFMKFKRPSSAASMIMKNSSIKKKSGSPPAGS